MPAYLVEEAATPWRDLVTCPIQWQAAEPRTPVNPVCWRTSNPQQAQSVFVAPVRAAKKLEDYIAFRFSDIRSVSRVLVGEIEEVLHVWVLMAEWSSALRREVYGRQLQLINEFKGEEFDFYVVSAPEDDDAGLITTSLPTVWARE